MNLLRFKHRSLVGQTPLYSEEQYTKMDYKKAFSCCRPFPKTSKKCSSEKRFLTVPVIEKLKLMGCNIPLDTSSKICGSCRLFLYASKPKQGNTEEQINTEEQPSNPDVDNPIAVGNTLEEVPSTTSVVSASSQDSQNSNIPEYSRAYNIEIFNKGITGINVSPILTRRLGQASYPEQKFKEITKGIRKNIFSFPQEEDEESNYKQKASEFDEIINQLKEKFFHTETTRSEKIRILTILPKSWSVQKMEEEFGVNKYMAAQAKKLVNEKGVLSTPHNKCGPSLSEDVKNQVLEFYNDDDISRSLPGERDYVSVSKDGKRQHIQKRLLIMSLRETFNRFKEIYPNCKIGFSSFASVRPKHCKLLSNSGTHNVCVCTSHENVNLMLHSLKKYSFNIDCKEYMEKIVCNTSNRSKYCYLRECENCQTLDQFEKWFLEELQERNLIEITYEQWISTDRCDIETLVKPVDEFVSYFCEKLEKLLTHDYIKTQQSTFLNNIKANLQENEVVVICDFSENYSFVLQDEVQSHHWNNDQATIHPFVIYYKDEKDSLKIFSFVVISEVLTHDTIAVHVFISKLITFLKQQIQIKRIKFMSDGAASQYKNRKIFASLCEFKLKYDIDAEWHFFATSHGKGPCDAIGGTIKRMATRASLARQHEHPITSAKSLFDWASKRNEEYLTKLSFSYVSQEEYDQGVEELSSMYNKTKLIPGTQKYHSFVPISENKVAAKLYSNDNATSYHNVYRNVRK